MQVLQVEEGYCAEKQSQTRNSMLISGFLKIRDSLTVLTPVILTEIGSLWAAWYCGEIQSFVASKGKKPGAGSAWGKSWACEL